MKNEYKVGITIFLALFSLLVAMLTITDLRVFNQSGRSYKVTFKFLNNLMVGGHVKLYGGIKVGGITDLTHKDGKALVTFLITDKTVNEIFLSQKTKLKLAIKGAGLLGEKYLLIKMGETDGNYFEIERKDNKIVNILPFEGEEATDFENLLTKLDGITGKVETILEEDVRGVMGSIRGHLDDGKVASILTNLVQATNSLNKLMDNTNDMIVNIKDNHIDKTFNRVDETLESVNFTIRSTNREINAISSGLRRVLTNTDHNLDELLYNRKSGIHQVTGGAVEVMRNMNSLVNNLKTMMKNLENPKTPMGALLKDEGLTKEIKGTIENLNNITNSLKDHPLIDVDEKSDKGPF